MNPVLILQALTLLLGFYMAWNIGANDVANAMGTSVGSKALTLRRAVFIAAILVHWSTVSQIVSSWILSPVLSGVVSYLIFNIIQKKILYALNPIEATKQLAPFFVFLCFNVVLLSLFYHGLHQVAFNLSFSTALSISCAISLIAALISQFLIRRISESEMQLVESPAPYQAVSLEKALHHMQRVHLSNQNTAYGQRISQILDEIRGLNDEIRRNMPFQSSTTQYRGVERIFVFLQILSACLVAFAHGANDAANAIGPVAAILGVLKTNAIMAHSEIPSWLLAWGGAGIVIGLATWGWRVIETIGSKITELTPTRGFAAEFGAAATILFASKLGLPISTTHALVGSVFGVGMARGLKALNLQMLKEIVVSWIVTIPLCAILSILLFYLLKFFFI